jgi:hypothetical protein
MNHDTSRWTINESYRLKFENQTNVIENMGGQLYRDSTLNIVSKQRYKDYNQLKLTEQTHFLPRSGKPTHGKPPFSSQQQPKQVRPAQERATQQLHQQGRDSYIQQRLNRLNQHKSYGNVTIMKYPNKSFLPKGPQTTPMTADDDTSRAPRASRRLDTP